MTDVMRLAAHLWGQLPTPWGCVTPEVWTWSLGPPALVAETAVPRMAACTHSVGHGGVCPRGARRRWPCTPTVKMSQCATLRRAIRCARCFAREKKYGAKVDRLQPATEMRRPGAS